MQKVIVLWKLLYNKIFTLVLCKLHVIKPLYRDSCQMMYDQIHSCLTCVISSHKIIFCLCILQQQYTLIHTLFTDNYDENKIEGKCTDKMTWNNKMRWEHTSKDKWFELIMKTFVDGLFPLKYCATLT